MVLVLSRFGQDLRVASGGDTDIILPLIERIYSDYV